MAIFVNQIIQLTYSNSTNARLVMPCFIELKALGN